MTYVPNSAVAELLKYLKLAFEKVTHLLMTWRHSNSLITYVYSINADVQSITKLSQSLPIKEFLY